MATRRRSCLESGPFFGDAEVRQNKCQSPTHSIATALTAWSRFMSAPNPPGSKGFPENSHRSN
eukprot:1818025-Heterocapsa_arctica.AAC.1